MPSKQIKEFTPAAGRADLTDQFIFQSEAGFTQMLTAQSFLEGFGYTYWDNQPALPGYENSKVQLTTAGAFPVTLFQDSSDYMGLELHANQGNTSPDIWRIRADAIADTEAQGVLRLQSYVAEGFTDILTLKSHKTTDANASSVEIKDLLKVPAMNLDGGRVVYEDDLLRLDEDTFLTLQTGTPFCVVRWSPDDLQLSFEGHPTSTASTHLLFHKDAFIGFGGVKGDNYLKTQVYDSGDGVLLPTGISYSGARGYGNAVDFQILNRDEGSGSASLTLTQDHGQNAGDTMQLEYLSIDNGSGSPSGTTALVVWTDHNDIGTPADPVVVIKGSGFHASRGVGIHGNLHVSKEMRMHSGGINFAGHMVGGRLPESAQGKYTGFKSPASFDISVSSHVYEMPGDFPPVDKVLQSDTSGVLTWTTLPTTGTGTVSAGTQYKVAYYPDVDATLVDDTSALYWKNGRLGVNEADPQTDIHLKSTTGGTVRLERREPGPIVGGNKLGTIEFYGFDEGVTNDFEGVGAKIVAEASGIWSYNTEGDQNDTQTELQFWTTPNGMGEAATKQMVIEDSGVIYHAGATYTDIEDGGTVGDETVDLDLDASDLHKLILNGNLTLTFSNEKEGQRFLIRVLQSSGGGYTITWPLGITWVNGVEGQPTSTDGRATIFGFIATSETTFDGFVVGKNIG